MDLLTLFRILWRRWYVVAAMLLLTALASAAAYTRVSPSYQTTGSVLLLNPPASTDPATGRSNPYVGNLIVAGQVVTNVLDSAAYRVRLRTEGATGDYMLGVDPNSPIIRVTTTADTPAEATETTATVMSFIDTVLRDRQQELSAPSHLFVRTQVITPPSEPFPLNGSKVRAALAVAALGGALTIGAAFATDGILRRNPRRRRSELTARQIDHPVECLFCEMAFDSGDMVEHLSRAHGLHETDDLPRYTQRRPDGTSLVSDGPPDRGSRRSNPRD